MKKQLRKPLALLLALCMLFAALPPIALATDGVLEGSGTEDSPYLIADAQDLAAFRDMVNGGTSLDAHAKLTADIELTGDWSPIYPTSGYVTNMYAGVFDGDFHTISGLYINSTESNQGLFGGINGATVKNLKVIGDVTSSNNYVGGIVGKLVKGAIENCSFEGNVTTTKSGGYAGGIAGYTGNGSTQTGSIINCSNSAAVTGGYAGGITSYAKYSTITECYNVGKITGTGNTGGIAGQIMNNTVISNCYSIGEVTSSGNAGGIVGFNGVANGITNCYWTNPDVCFVGGTGSADGSEKITSPDGLTEKLGDAFVEGSGSINGGYPILKWQQGGEPVPKNPHITITGSTVLQMQNNGAVPQTTLSVNYIDMDAAPVTWDTDSDIITLEEPTDADENNSKIIVKAQKPGKAVVTVSTTDGAYTAEQKITVMPFVTVAEIEGDVVVGETVRAKVYVLGGDEYDYDNYPELAFRWKYLTAGDYLSGNTGSTSYHIIEGATNREFTITDDLKGCYLSFEFYYNGEYKTPSSPQKIHSASYSQLLSDCENLSIATDDIKENTVIDLPSAGENGSVITWKSNHPEIIDTNGNVTLPDETTTEVTLTATLSLEGETTVKTFKIKVYSKKAVEDEQKEEQREKDLNKLDKIKIALGNFYKITPVYGTDTNIVDILKADIAKKSDDYSDCAVSLSKVEMVYGGANIAGNGDITYFYADPNTTPSIKMGSFRATFTLTIGEAETTLEVPVIVYWDQDRVKETMRSEILSSVTATSILGGNTAADHVTDNLVLPKVVDGKKWTLISWQSSDNGVISISSENQSTADTLFDPYVGKVKRGAEDKTVTLTAIFTFQLTNDITGSETPITMSKTFDVTVKAVGAEQIEAIQADLNAKLDAGFEKAGITDAVTGDKLSPDDGVYTAYNDIQFPTTRDFGVDGKYCPVTLSSDNAETVIAPDVNNAARVEVYRPAVGNAGAGATVTLTITDTNSNVSVSRKFNFTVPALTAEEVETEKALMHKVRAAYFDGIKGNNTDAGDISSNLSPFIEVYEDKGSLVWVRDNAERTNHGIVTEPIEGWEELEVWRLFRSSNPAAVTHENLLVTQQKKDKAVTVDSVLSSETLGRYGELYGKDPIKYASYADLAELYRQPVSAELVVRGTSTPINVRPTAVEEKVGVTFRLQSADGMLIDTVRYRDLKEGTTVFDIFKKAMDENGYTYKKHGSYVYSITTPDGTEIKELDEGKNSGWLYKVNGEIPDMQMAAYGLHDGDSIVMFFSKDFTEDTGYDRPSGSSRGRGGSSGTPKPDASASPTPSPSPTDDADASPTSAKTPAPDKAATYSDIDGHWAQNSIIFVTEQRLMYGTENGKFDPDLPLTRAMMAVIIYRLEGEPETASESAFADVESGSYYENAAAWANGNGIVSGTSETEFSPTRNITREQAAALLYRYALYKGYDASVGSDSDISAYTDAEEISDYASEAMRYALGSGLMTGRTENTLNPKDNMTRAETAEIFRRFTETNIG